MIKIFHLQRFDWEVFEVIILNLDSCFEMAMILLIFTFIEFFVNAELPCSSVISFEVFFFVCVPPSCELSVYNLAFINRRCCIVCFILVSFQGTV